MPSRSRKKKQPAYTATIKKPSYTATIVATAIVSAIVTLVAVNQYNANNKKKSIDLLQMRTNEVTDFYFIDPEYIVFEEQLQKNDDLIVGVNAHLLNRSNFPETYEIISSAVFPVEFNRTLRLKYSKNNKIINAHLNSFDIYIPYRVNFDAADEVAQMQKCISKMELLRK